MKIQSAIRTYDVSFSDNAIEGCRSLLEFYRPGRPFFFVDANVARLYAESLSGLLGLGDALVIDALESNKEYVRMAAFIQHLLDRGFRKSDVLVTVGGGILQDISGFLATVLFRGIRWVLVPTTLLAQADSCLGSKTSINFGSAKNLVGSFYPPHQVIIDTKFCETLTDGDVNSGIGEIIKFHLMSDTAGYATLQRYLAYTGRPGAGLLREMTESTLAIKAAYVRDDEFDRGRRNLCNYGHCFGHALESASDFTVVHGEGVVVGMAAANRVALRRGAISRPLFDELESLLRQHFPAFDLSLVSPDDVVRFMRKDKKRTGAGLTVIVLKAVGDLSKWDDVTEEEAREAYAELAGGKGRA